MMRATVILTGHNVFVCWRVDAVPAPLTVSIVHLNGPGGVVDPSTQANPSILFFGTVTTRITNIL